jgi:DNA-binding transcriptional LysR family regulator
MGQGRSVVAVSGTLRANNGDALVAAALAGAGIVYMPTFLVAREIATGRLVALDLDQPAIELDGIFGVYPGGRRPPAKVRATINLLAERLGPVPPWEREPAARVRL